MKRALIIRLGAFGDCIMITPVLHYLKKQGYYIILNTNKRGMTVFKDDPVIDEFIKHNEDIPISKVVKHWEDLKKKVKHDLCINFSGSIEQNVALHPSQPQYIYPKNERKELCDKNYYDETIRWSKLPADKIDKKPVLYFTKEAESGVQKHIKADKFNILWCLSGSGSNKVYPWTEYVMGEMLKNYPDVHIITVGDEKCQLLENIYAQMPTDRVTELAGKISMRESMCLTKFVDLVISPDTGVLHASGCYTTPKIGLLGHTTKENITKYFDSDYSIEAKCDCAPCFRLIYRYDLQCPVHTLTKAALCMQSITPEEVYEQFVKVRKGLPA